MTILDTNKGQNKNVMVKKLAALFLNLSAAPSIIPRGHYYGPQMKMISNLGFKQRGLSISFVTYMRKTLQLRTHFMCISKSGYNSTAMHVK